MHKSATKCNETVGKWYKNKHGASKIIDTLETYQQAWRWRRPLVAIPFSGRVLGRASGPSRSRVNDGGGLWCVSRKLIGCLGFSHRGVFIGEGAALEVDQGALTIGRRGQGLDHAPWWWGWPLAPLRLLFGLLEASLNIGMFGFFLSNSENISCVTFLKHKNNRK
jgi:hypothetical protein